MITPREFSYVTPGDLGGIEKFENVCAMAGLDPAGGPNPLVVGYGFLHCADESGKHWTLVGDPEYVRTLEAGASAGVLSSLSIAEDQFPLKRTGWPDEWVLKP